MIEKTNLSVKHHDELSFKKMVRRQHELGGFIDDNYRMEVDFKTRKSCIDLIGVSLENDEGEVVAFCGIEVFIGQDDLVGYMHCLGVPKDHRKKGYSTLVIDSAEKAIIEKMPKISRILTVCNEAGLGVYGKAGYEVTNNGRLSRNNKRSQIRMQKVIIDKFNDGDTRYARQSKPRGPRVERTTMEMATNQYPTESQFQM